MEIKIEEVKSKGECFVIMPIRDPDSYESGHFSKVYEDIFRPAILQAGYTAIRADDILQTNLIHLDILQRLLESPMAICDLSSRNPNVLFELGLRQAFDKPTVLIQEKGTPDIFDVSVLRITDYHRELKYREVLDDQDRICEAIKATDVATKNGDGVNSLVKLLELSKAAFLNPESLNDPNQLFQIINSEIKSLKNEIRSISDFKSEGWDISGADRLTKPRSDSSFIMRSLHDFERIKREFEIVGHTGKEALFDDTLVIENLQYIIHSLWRRRQESANKVFKDNADKLINSIRSYIDTLERRRNKNDKNND